MLNGCVPERSKGADLRSAAVMLRGFESHHAHHFFYIILLKLTKQPFLFQYRNKIELN